MHTLSADVTCTFILSSVLAVAAATQSCNHAATRTHRNRVHVIVASVSENEKQCFRFVPSGDVQLLSEFFLVGKCICVLHVWHDAKQLPVVTTTPRRLPHPHIAQEVAESCVGRVPIVVRAAGRSSQQPGSNSHKVAPARCHEEGSRSVASSHVNRVCVKATNVPPQIGTRSGNGRCCWR